MIYRYCLTANSKIIKPPSKKEQYYPGCATPSLDMSHGEIDATVQRHRANCQWYVRLSQSHTGLVPKLELSWMRVSKSIHVEAASVLYGENEFQFVLAITRRHPRVTGSTFDQPSYYDFRDNLTVVSKAYLKMIKKCTIEVRLPNFPWTWAKKMYLEYYARLAAFANCFGGDDHSLQKVAVLFNRCFTRGYYFPLSCLRESQNVLESLATIHGVRLSVIAGGVTPDFEAKLSLAMMSPKIACIPKEEQYGMRMVWFKSKRGLQSHKLGRYYDSKKVWSHRVPGPYRTRYRCCEVCDGKPPLVFPQIRRPP